MLNLWLYGSQQTMENSSRDGNARPPYLSPEKLVWRSRELDMGQWTDSKLGKAYIKAAYNNPDYLISIQSTSWEMPDWMDHKLESRFPGEIRNINNLIYTNVTIWYHLPKWQIPSAIWHLMAESEEELKSLLMKVKEESEKAELKLNIQKTKIMAFSPITS